MSLRLRQERCIKRTQRYGNPIGIFTLGTGPEQGRAALLTELARDRGRRRIPLDAIGAANNAQHAPQDASVGCECSSMTFTTLAAMAMTHRLWLGD